MAVTLTVDQGRLDATPEQVGMDPVKLAKLEPYFANMIEAGKLQGASYLVARDGKIVLHQAQGKLTPKDDGRQLKTDSIRKVYSITKVITAMAAVKLMEQGKLYLHQPVCSIIPEFDTNQHRSITIWHLLTHTSGIKPDPGVMFEPYTFPWYEWCAREINNNPEHYKQEDWIKAVIGGQPLSKPGENWYYCSAGFALVGEIISRVSGMHFEQYVQEHIAKPLGMNRSFFVIPEHLRNETAYTGDWEEKEIYNPDDHLKLPPKGGNGYYSTLEDLYRLGQVMLNEGTLDGFELLGRRTARMMVTNQLDHVKNRCWGANDDHARHGIGWALTHHDICTPGTFSHEGYGSSALYVDPVEKLLFAYITPYTGEWKPEAVINPRALVWSSLL